VIRKYERLIYVDIDLLIEKRPDLVNEWDFQKNIDLDLYSISKGSGRKAWWKCNMGHEWQAAISSRAKGHNCPYCSGKYATLENCIVTTYPKILDEWDYEKNSSIKITPYDVSKSSDKKVWWRCNKGHSWRTEVKNRTKGMGCPYCSGRRVCEDNCLATLRPELSVEWHPTKNNLTPHQVSIGSPKKVWWLGKCGHEWQSAITSRSKGGGCPICSNRLISNDNCLATTHPDLVREWDHKMNKNTTPYNLCHGSIKKVYWKCKNNHKWVASPFQRTVNNVDCPICNSVGFKYKELFNEWNVEKNKSLSPFDLSCGSGRRVWWKCDQGHEWITAVVNRTGGTGCPYCSGVKVTETTSLSSLFPHLSNEWNYEKNGEITPDHVMPSSNKKLWWKCSRGHEWDATPNSRTSKNNGCPYCSNKRVNIENCLITTQPNLAKEWHPTRNIGITPFDITAGANKKVWWQCDKGHEWETTPNNRTSGSGCPICNKETQTSFPEQAIFYYMSKVFNDVKNGYVFKYNNKRIELDIYISDINLGIEYDGEGYHKEKSISNDEYKNMIINKQKINLVRVREEGCPKINMNNHHLIICPSSSNSDYIYINEIVIALLNYIKKKYLLEPEILERINMLNIDIVNQRNEIFSMYLKEQKNNSLLILKPKLAAEWNYLKNGKLRPDHVTYNSRKAVWWLCCEGHEWQTPIYQRVNSGCGCPFCLGRKPSENHNLAKGNPILAKEWHPIKNANLTPYDVTPISNIRVWWLGDCGHEWESAINNRAQGYGCPYCAGQKVSKENCLATNYPSLALQWNHSRNGEMTPYEITKNSGKKVWWVCEKGHEWEASVDNRVKGRGCPYCSNRKVCKDNALSTTHPNLASEWNYNRNLEMTPENVTAGSNKKAWWKCSEGHEWYAVIASRAAGNGCSHCSGKRKVK
jgi:hypothetical protein